MRAGDLMQTDVVTVRPDTPLLQVHRLFVEEEIHGAPVVDEDGDVVGVISSLDLLRAVQEEHDSGAARTSSIYFRDQLPYSGPDWLGFPEDFQDRLAGMTAADIMATEIVAVSTDTPLTEAARLMRAQRIHRLLVVDQRQLRGILTTFDLLSSLEHPERPGPPAG